MASHALREQYKLHMFQNESRTIFGHRKKKIIWEFGILHKGGLYDLWRPLTDGLVICLG